jgi:two-component system, OmpR family, response regulator
MRVLLVEDKEETARSVSSLLGQDGHVVEVAADGETAVCAARANPPDVVLLGIGLPGIDGYEVARRVQEQPSAKRPLMVVVRGRGQEEDRPGSQEAGIDLHLVKPVLPAYLKQLLSRFRQVIAEPQESL